MDSVINYKTKLIFIADGENCEFNFNFEIYDRKNIDVYLNEEIQTRGYEVVLGENGGEIIFAEAPLSGTQVTIIRNLPIKRTTDFQEGGPFRASRVNGEFDYQVACLEQVEEKLSRVIYKPAYLVDDSNLSLPTPVAGRTLIWSEDNTGLKNSKYDVDNLENQLSEAVTSVMEAKRIVDEKEEIVSLAEKYIIPNTHNIGEIFTDGFVGLLDGQGWCQGDILPTDGEAGKLLKGLTDEFERYTVEATTGIAWVDFTTYETILSNNDDNCVFFGYDSVNHLVRLPKIRDFSTASVKQVVGWNIPDYSTYENFTT
ncbi:MAG: hypothetical protein ACK5N8_03460, partial [Alphaproteobacteria bacterium]